MSKTNQLNNVNNSKNFKYPLNDLILVGFMSIFGGYFFTNSIIHFSDMISGGSSGFDVMFFIFTFITGLLAFAASVIYELVDYRMAKVKNKIIYAPLFGFISLSFWSLYYWAL